jgi:hypothetical protein
MITLFVLANAHTEDGDEPPSCVRLRDAGPLVSIDEAAAYLHSLRKPIGLDAYLRDGVLTVRTDDELTEVAEILLPTRLADDGYDFVRARYGPFIADLEVVCFSGERCLRVTLADFRQFEREYFLGKAGNRGMDFVDSGYSIAQGAKRSDVAGATLFVSFR